MKHTICMSNSCIYKHAEKSNFVKKLMCTKLGRFFYTALSYKMKKMYRILNEMLWGSTETHTKPWFA